VSGYRFLDPAVLARIENLELLARTVVSGFISGLHRSPYLGFSIDFAEHRAYMPGDDIRWIDWRVFGRTDRFYVKQFEADTNANFTVLLDVSRSMGYGSRSITKLDYARYLAACLTYFSRRQRDRVGIVTFDGAVREHVPPSARHLDIVLHTLDRLELGGAGGLEAPLLQVAQALRRRGIVVLLSDLYEDPGTVVRALNRLRHKGSDVIVFHLLDPAELEFPFADPIHFEDLESGDRTPVVPEEMAARYRTLVATHVSTLARLLGENRIDYTQLSTAQPLDYALFEYLGRRLCLSRVR
jgi:uncharacterized protein (DUF58 family)